MRKGLLIAAVMALSVTTAQACRYSVHDIAFVELQAAPYRLFCFVRSDTPPESVAALKRNAYAALLDSNVGVEIVNVDEEKENQAFEYLPKGNIVDYPCAMLVRHDGKALRIELPSDAKTFKKDSWPALESIVASPARKKIVASIVESFAVVLLVEGADAEENQRARENARSAIEFVKEKMAYMPKPVEVAPELVVVERKGRGLEKVLFWSLGIDAGEEAGASAVVLHGRGRRIGPTLHGGKLTEEEMINVLGVIGADCECGLDRIWLEGDRIPMTWTKKSRERAAKTLGFDPDSPAVQIEVSQILAKGPQGNVGQGEASGQMNIATLGYSEQIIEFKNEPVENPVMSPAELQRMMAPGGEAVSSATASATAIPSTSQRTTASAATAAPIVLENHGAVRRSILLLACLGAFVIAGASIVLFVVMRARERSA